MEISRIVCKAVIFNKLDNLLLIQRSEDDRYRPLCWEPVGGKWDGRHETFQEALEREIYEETELKIKDARLIDARLEDIETEYAERDQKDTYLLIGYTALTGSSFIRLSAEHHDKVWLPPPYELDGLELSPKWAPTIQHAIDLRS